MVEEDSGGLVGVAHIAQHVKVLRRQQQLHHVRHVHTLHLSRRVTLPPQVHVTCLFLLHALNTHTAWYKASLCYT